MVHSAISIAREVLVHAQAVSEFFRLQVFRNALDPDVLAALRTITSNNGPAWLASAVVT